MKFYEKFVNIECNGAATSLRRLTQVVTDKLHSFQGFLFVSNACAGF